MKITLSTKFFDELLQLDFLTQNYVLSVCKRLSESDEDAILEYELPFDAPELLVELVNALKTRVANARRRRERRAAAPAKVHKTADEQSAAKLSTADKPVSAAAVMEMYELAVNVVISSGNTLNRADRSRIRQLAKALMKRMDSIATTSRPQHGCKRRA